MEAQTETGNVTRIRGRKNKDKLETVIKKDVIEERIDTLCELQKKAALAAEDFNAAVKKAAEDSGLNAGAVKKFVLARVGDSFEDKKRDCQQLCLLFEEVGE